MWKLTLEKSESGLCSGVSVSGFMNFLRMIYRSKRVSEVAFGSYVRPTGVAAGQHIQNTDKRFA